ncbi:GntR family transcriptional regulator [Isoptericola nanjingensis]
MPLSPPRRPLPATSALVDGVYQVLLDAIVEGELAPGEVVKESEVGELLGVSRTPVREAFRRLAEIGMLRIEVNRGSRIADLDPNHLRQVGDLLAELVGYASRLALPRLSGQDVSWLTTLGEKQMRTALRAPENYELHAIELHDLFIARADNAVLEKVTAGLRPHIDRLVHARQDRLVRLEQAQQFASIIAAVRENDADLLQGIVSAYWRYFTEQMLAAT